MKRGEVWIVSRLGGQHRVIIVGQEALTRDRSAVLTVPISEVSDPLHAVEPFVSDEDGAILGVAKVPRVGEVSKEYLKARTGALAPSSVEDVNLALRAALGL